MTTLRLPHADQLSEDDRATLEAVARRLGATPDTMSDIWRAQTHWPRYLEVNQFEERSG